MHILITGGSGFIGSNFVRTILADTDHRITNLDAPPPYWKPDKIAAYRDEAATIRDRLGHASPALAARLSARIEAYPPS